MPIGLRLIVLIVLAAVPVFLVQLFHDLQTRDARERGIVASAQTLAELAAARQNRLVEGTRLLLATAAHLQSVRERDAALCSRRFAEIAERVPELTAIAVVDTAGERWCSSSIGAQAKGSPGDPDSGERVNIGDRAYFQATLKTGTFQSSDFIVGRVTGEGSVVFTYPVQDVDRPIQSVVFAAYRTSALARLLNEPPLPQDAFAILLDRTGKVAARWPDPEAWTGRDLSAVPVVRQAIAQRLGTVRAQADFAGPGEFAFAFAPVIPPSGLTVLVAVSLSTALRETEALFWRSVGWTSVIFILAALLASIGSHFMVASPIRQLNEAVDALAQGEFRSPRASALASRELRVLARQFAAMAQALQHREAELVEALQQKELLLREVNHRVKNSLQLVASLFALQRSKIQDPTARREFEEAGRRINTVAQIHQRLYQDENVDRVALHAFLEELCAELGKISDRVTIDCRVEPGYLPTQMLIPVALIANELITNALKYSYPDDAGGVIRVACRPDGDALVLSVSDDGAALPDDFDPSRSDGLGMRIIAGLSSQIGATFELARQPKGKAFVLRIPAEGDPS